MWVKASGGAFWSASDRMFLRADFKGVNLAGTGEVSREALLHGFLYQKLPTIRAILHVHAPYAIAWSATHDRLMRVTLQAGLKLKYDIPVLPIVTPTVGAETLPQVEEMLRSRPGLQAFILKQHGIVAMGTSPLGAEHVAELIEQTAKSGIFGTRTAGRKPTQTAGIRPADAMERHKGKFVRKEKDGKDVLCC
jgi:L-fuculose-phosphate aldolase/L-ribulose-5-phosphate 4-epimerase